MELDSFQRECDRLSSAVDSAQFERFRWDRDEAPKLAHLVDLVTEAFAGRRDFELAEEGATSGFKRFVIKVHSKRTIGIAVLLKNGHAVIGAEAVERSSYTVAPGEPISANFDDVDEQWVADTLQTLIGRIRAGSH